MPSATAPTAPVGSASAPPMTSAMQPAGGGGFLESTFGKALMGQLGGKGGEKPTGGDLLKRGLGKVSQAGDQVRDQAKQRQIQALIAAGMDPAMAAALAGSGGY
jgi:hypothetical protein